MGLYGFMEGETPQPGIADLPAEDVQLVKDTLAGFMSGELNRFDVFEGVPGSGFEAMGDVAVRGMGVLVLAQHRLARRDRRAVGLGDQG